MKQRHQRQQPDRRERKKNTPRKGTRENGRFRPRAAHLITQHELKRGLFEYVIVHPNAFFIPGPLPCAAADDARAKTFSQLVVIVVIVIGPPLPRHQPAVGAYYALVCVSKKENRSRPCLRREQLLSRFYSSPSLDSGN